MKIDRRTIALLLIIALEGFAVLAAELVAMRQTISFVGSGSDTFAIIIAAVLIPIAFGYQAGGRFTQRQKNGSYLSIRKKLIKNITIAAAFLIPALSYFIAMFFFYGVGKIGVHNNLIQLTLYCLLFICPPVYLLGQTVPLISNYFSKQKRAEITGSILCMSTLGSFCGSIITTLFLMQYIGLHNTVTFIFVVLLVPVLILSRKSTRDLTMVMISIIGVAGILNSPQLMASMDIVKNNKYSTMMVFDDDDGITHLMINNNDSSMYGPNGEKHTYIEYAEKITIEALPQDAQPKDVLIIGAGGFTFGHNDEKNNFVYIDIDNDLKKVSEQYLLKEPLKANKSFYALPARAYLNGTDKKFDVILLDAYLGGLSIPEHLVTLEFFEQIKTHLKDDAVLVTNFIVSPNFNNAFSKNIDNTLRAVFPYVSRTDTEDEWDIWTTSKVKHSNFMYVYKHHVE